MNNPWLSSCGFLLSLTVHDIKMDILTYRKQCDKDILSKYKRGQAGWDVDEQNGAISRSNSRIY